MRVLADVSIVFIHALPYAGSTTDERSTCFVLYGRMCTFGGVTTLLTEASRPIFALLLLHKISFSKKQESFASRLQPRALEKKEKTTTRTTTTTIGKAKTKKNHEVDE